MTCDRFKAWIALQHNGQTNVQLKELETLSLPEGQVLVQIAYSALNYKDGLAMTGKGNVIRKFPMIPGIDFAGIVVESASSEFQSGDQVVLTGAGAGESHWGGFSQMARVPADWLVPLPANLSLRQAMGIGTAGVTAMLCTNALEDQGLQPSESREVVVTGATGGVGSLAVSILSCLGYNVVAASGRNELFNYLQQLGARTVMSRSDLLRPVKSLETQRWSGAIDTVGGEMLTAILPSMAQNSSIACCGNAGGSDFHTTVFPFILRGVSLLGINSVTVPKPQRLSVWARLSDVLPLNALDAMIQVVPLAALQEVSTQLLGSKLHGRIVVDVNA